MRQLLSSPLLPGAILDIDPSRGLAVVGGKVSSIEDQASGLIATQASEAARPDFIAVSPNTGRPTMRFSGAQFFSFGDVQDLGTDSLTVYAAVRVGVIPSGFFSPILAKSAAANQVNRWGLLQGSQSTNGLFHGSAVSEAAITQTTGTVAGPQVIAWRIDRAARTNTVQAKGQQSTVSFTTAATHDVQSAFALLLGAYLSSTGAILDKYFFIGDMERVLRYNTAHTDAQMLENTEALKDMYNIPNT